jgi:alkylation response protein AidB-like acyl-CoA dehydrogenase
MVGASHLRLKDGVNLAGEPLDSVDPPGGGEDVLLKGALIRSIQMAGALERILELTINYTRERHQFGRSLMRFQAVQQALALMAGEVAAAGATVDAAVETPDAQRVAIAKIRTGLAAGQASAIAHQLHGAIGLSQEHQLHHFTRRLWSWRDDFGTEHDWATRLGQQLLSSGQLWAALT